MWRCNAYPTYNMFTVWLLYDTTEIAATALDVLRQEFGESVDWAKKELMKGELLGEPG